MGAKFYIIAFLGISLVVGLATSHWFAYSAGKDKILANQAELMKERDGRIVDLQIELEEEKAKRKVIYRDKIKIIREAADPTGCADATPPADILQQFER